ncbi:RNA 2',3'-cyclic phosphodiesterase [Planococcus sp. N028]|uniref:RNA 2',3'-cyclic phosphodiesterase n=1 Tax=Planococcus shixiaomingii TaxID=3058393 RepID=A0ABT8MX27_9BACL|nr:MULTISPECIES: RNA 2',3'-cyclic phosphodiesterase [unclassified Planococcus (in: firmicutes)]MDN7240193.1 RNA 2',3'-cyclic phosphodiesterase [Planococcus sp. N028]WKA56097.1 RNA 2',3'-cyclic phosphodiesterase [Planococcus sp. N022]
MSKHYFIGIKIPAHVASQLDEARKEWNLTSHKRYTPPIDMHITLLFIGNDPNSEIDAAAKALQGVAYAPFELKIDGVKTFGNPRTPRIVYASVEESRELSALQEQVKQVLQPFELNPDPKPFVPHITLAGKWKGGPPLLQQLTLEPATFQVKEFSVFQIEPQQVPRYIPIQTYQLKEG